MTSNKEWNDFVEMWRSKHDGDCPDIRACIKSLCKSLDISVPVTVTPFAIPGVPAANCADEYEVIPHSRFKFTVTQKMNVTIPVLFGAEICFDDAFADNGECN